MKSTVRLYAMILCMTALIALCLKGQADAQTAGTDGKKGLMPESAQSVIDKMDQYEEKIILEAQEKIEQKRREVIRFLEGRLDAETRSGNLDGGLTIRDEIERLKSLSRAEPVAIAKAGDDKAAPGDGPHPIIGRWKFKDKDGSVLVREFTAAGKCIQFRNGSRELSLDYAVVNDREVDVIFLGALRYRHSVRGNDTLKTMEPDAIAEREPAEAAGSK